MLILWKRPGIVGIPRPGIMEHSARQEYWIRNARMLSIAGLRDCARLKSIFHVEVNLREIHQSQRKVIRYRFS